MKLDLNNPRIANPPCYEFLGCEMLSFEEGKVVVRATAREEWNNPMGSAQGGILTGLLDNCIGPTSVTVGDVPFVAAEITTRYLRPVLPGTVLIVTSNVVHKGRSMLVIEAEIRGEDDKLYAAAQATLLPGKF